PDLRAVDGEVDGPPEPGVVPKQRARGVENIAPERESRLDEELRFVHPVLRDETTRRVEVGTRHGMAQVGFAALDVVEYLGVRGGTEIDDELGDVMWPLPPVERVALEKDALSANVLREVVRARPWEGGNALGVRRARRRPG